MLLLTPVWSTTDPTAALGSKSLQTGILMFYPSYSYCVTQESAQMLLLQRDFLFPNQSKVVCPLPPNHLASVFRLQFYFPNTTYVDLE